MANATLERTEKRPAAAEQAARENAARARRAEEARKAREPTHEQPVDEAAATKAAISRAVADVGRSVGHAADVRLWTKKSPWIALGVAATTGLVAAVAVRRGIKPESKNGEPPQPPSPKPKSEEPAKAGWTASLANSLFDLAKVAVETAIMTSIRETAGRHFGNGEPDEPIVTHAE